MDGEEWIESKIPNLDGKTLEEIANDPSLRDIARRLADELCRYPGDSVIICSDPLEIGEPGSRPGRKKRR